MEVLFSVIVYFLAFFLCYTVYEKAKQKLNGKKCKRINKTMFLMLAMLPLILLFVLRKNVGTDYLSYVEYFNVLKVTPISFNVIFKYFIEPGWVLLSYLIIILKLPYCFFLLIVSIIYFLFIVLIMEKFESKNGRFVFFLLSSIVIFMPFLNLMRQELASIIVLYACLCLTNNNYKKTTLLIILASLFHKSALIAFLYVILWQVIDKKKNYKVLMWGTYTSIIWGNIIGVTILTILQKFGLTSGYYRINTNSSYGFILYTVPVLILVIYLNIIKLDLFDDKKNRFFLLIYSLSIVFQVIGNYILMVDRLAIYFNNFQVLLIPILLENVKEELNKKIIFLVIFWYFFYFIVMFVLINANHVIPYNIIFF